MVTEPVDTVTVCSAAARPGATTTTEWGPGPRLQNIAVPTSSVGISVAPIETVALGTAAPVGSTTRIFRQSSWAARGRLAKLASIVTASAATTRRSHGTGVLRPPHPRKSGFVFLLMVVYSPFEDFQEAARAVTSLRSSNRCSEGWRPWHFRRLRSNCAERDLSVLDGFARTGLFHITRTRRAAPLSRREAMHYSDRVIPRHPSCPRTIPGRQSRVAGDSSVSPNIAQSKSSMIASREHGPPCMAQRHSSVPGLRRESRASRHGLSPATCGLSLLLRCAVYGWRTARRSLAAGITGTRGRND